ncbi:MAG: phosphotransferase [Desulfobacterales bacterium]|jgi:homoserine kinase type II|nr:phosphotransferase [Desulfobacterales bacterium]
MSLIIPLKTLIFVARQWGLSFKIIRPELELQGSPERSLFRTAFEDQAGGVFILEQVAPALRERKTFISSTLDRLYAEGLSQVAPYLKTPGGEFLAFCEGAWWQVSQFIPGTPLDRPAYIKDAPKGASLAQFLCDLARRCQKLVHGRAMSPFSLKRYILKLEKEMMTHDPDVGSRFETILNFLRQAFMNVHDTLPVAFCHGDYHPLNIIWQGNDIAAVIDWEFCGPKPDIYDAANLVGCIGMEHPSGLIDGLALSFIHAMRRDSVISAQSWESFADFVLAIRFAWLAEWLRKKDHEMINLEEAYMNLLVANMEMLKNSWEISAR